MGQESANDPGQERQDRKQRLLDEIRNNEQLMQQIRESEEYFRRGGPGIPWEEVEAKARARRSIWHRGAGSSADVPGGERL